MLDVLVAVDLLLAGVGEVLQEGVFVEQHHQLEKFILLHFHWYLLKRIVGIEIVLLQILPLEVLLQGEFVLQPECSVWILALKSILEVKD